MSDQSLASARGDAEPCEAPHPSGVLCTRDLGHDGDHAAHDERDRMVERWAADPAIDDNGKRVTDGSKVCGAFHPTEPYNCTRERGHPGDHFERAPGSEVLARWRAGETVESLRRELAASQEARLAAELRAEGLRGALERAEADASEDGVCAFCGELMEDEEPGEGLSLHDSDCPFARLAAAPPPDLATLRNLVRELLAATNLPPDQRFPAESPNRRLADGLTELLAAYPALDPGAEPAVEVPRG